VLEHVTASRAQDLLRRHGLAARKSLGQHFLVDPNTIRRIVRLAEVSADETVMEIGPGLGSLTVELARTAGRVIAVEMDESMTEALREVVAGADNVEIVVGDALGLDLNALIDGPARLIANLPYNVATPLIARVLEDVPSITGGLVMVQRQLGERWTAGPGSKTYAPISVKVAYHADARIAGEVPRSVFMPPPKVSSVLVSFTRHEPPVEVDDPKAFLRFVDAAFGHRRKNLRNSLTAAGHDSARAESALSAAGIDPATRPERLSIEAFASLYRELS
jgi:16S rRNA (adenine1518-N6/adenine1519-N6)-dimethyltransferase